LVFLVRAEPGVEFGFGARGEIYDAEVIEEGYTVYYDSWW